MIDTINKTARRIPNGVVYVLGALPFLWLVWHVINGTSGPDPVKFIERHAGLWGLQFLVAALAVTPLRRLGVNLIKMRRALGVLSFSYILLHFVTWIALDMGLDGGQILSALWKRPYILIGFAAFVAMVPLAATSNNWSIRRIGPKAWSRLHMLTYVIATAGAVHYLLLVKVITAKPVIYAAIIAGLLGWRAVFVARRKSVAA
jgi:methionine sulfoxide reductase heme-binding subunit